MSGPHDLLVRYTFENPERAAAELRAALPPFMVSQVDWKSLKAERNSVEHPDSELLPMIVPVVLYHGQDGAWTAPRRLEELFDVPREERELWLAVLPQFWYGLDDLTKQREEALRARAAPALVRLVLLALVYGRSAQLACLRNTSRNDARRA
jgi:hypothetical protein